MNNEVAGQKDAERHQWEEPGAFRVSEGVHRVPLPLPGDSLKAVNIYLVEDGDGLVLIDSGQFLEISRERLDAALKALGHSLGDIREFLITHIHHDHYTQAIALRREFGMRVRLGIGEENSLSLIRESSREVYANQKALLARCGAELAVKSLHRDSANDYVYAQYYEKPDGWLSDGGELIFTDREMRVFETPGHTRGHVVFYDEKDSLLFAGDHVLPHITPSVGFEPVVSDSALGDYLASLALVRSLPDAKLLPAHGPVTPSVHERIDELVAHHDKRLDTTLKAVAEGSSTPFEVAQALRWTRRERELGELDNFNQMLAIFETKMHLDLLALRGRAAKTLKDGVLHFSLA